MPSYTADRQDVCIATLNGVETREGYGYSMDYTVLATWLERKGITPDNFITQGELVCPSRHGQGDEFYIHTNKVLVQGWEVIEERAVAGISFSNIVYSGKYNLNGEK